MPNEHYSHLENAKNLSRMLIDCVPGNTLDEIIMSIRDEILPMLENQEKIEILKSPYDIDNRIRGALDKLSHREI